MDPLAVYEPQLKTELFMYQNLKIAFNVFRLN